MYSSDKSNLECKKDFSPETRERKRMNDVTSWTQFLSWRTVKSVRLGGLEKKEKELVERKRRWRRGRERERTWWAMIARRWNVTGLWSTLHFIHWLSLSFSNYRLHSSRFYSLTSFPQVTQSASPSLSSHPLFPLHEKWFWQIVMTRVASRPFLPPSKERMTKEQEIMIDEDKFLRKE